MKDMTIQVPITKIKVQIERGLQYLKEDKIQKWNARVDEEWEYYKGKRHFWIGPLKYTSREDVEKEFGKPEKEQNGKINTTWKLIRGASRQVIMYRQLLELANYDYRQVVTMTVLDYVTLMSFTDKKATITNSDEYFARDPDE